MKRPLPRSERRHSITALHAHFLERDRAHLEKYGQEYHNLFRHKLFPPGLSGRVKRMLDRIIDQHRQKTNLSRHATPEWLSNNHGLQVCRNRLAESIQVLRRYVREHHGCTEEFSPAIRRFMRGDDSDAMFRRKIGWSLRLFEEAVFGPEEKDMFDRHIYPD